MFNISKEYIKDTAIKGLKSVVVGTVVSAVSNKDNQKKVMKYILDKSSYVITEKSTNKYLYSKLCTWLYKLNDKNLNNNMNINQNISSGGDFDDTISSRNKIFITPGIYLIRYKKCLLYINVKKDCISIGEEELGNDQIITINIIGKHNRDIHNEINVFMSSYDADSICVYGDSFSRFISKKNIDSIYSDQIDDIINIIEKWKRTKNIYKQKNIPFKTGILLHGNPGTGKTSIAKALATYFNMNIQYINIASCGTREISHIYLRSDTIILFEELDLMDNRENKNNDSSKEYTEKLSALLNMLDGITSPENVIIIGTTNKVEALDQRLLRKGRFDNIIEVTDICRETAIKMCEGFGVEPDLILEEGQNKFNPSTLQDKILKII